MGVEECIYSMPAELDIYMKDSIFQVLGFCSTEELLKEKLAKAEESHRDLALSTQQRVRELEHKRAKSKEEAVLNAQALKRQVAKSQKLTEQYRVLKDECSRLQQESSLYHNDRDVFMEATYEAEDRAAEAEDRAAKAERRQETVAEELEQVKHRAAEAERRQETLVEELEQVKQLLEDTPIRLKKDHQAHVATLNSRITELEQQTVSLQEQVSGLRAERELTSESAVVSMYLPEKSILPDHLSAAKEQHEEISQKLKTEEETGNEKEGSRHDELAVHPDSPKRYKGSKDRLSQSGGGPRIKTYEGHGDDSVCVLCKARQPLMPLPANLVERKLNRCQNSSVDGILFSPSSPSFKEPDLCFRIETPF